MASPKTNVTSLPMSQLDRAAKDYSDARAAIDSITRELNADIEALKRKYIGKLKEAVGRGADKCAALENLIEANRDLFADPKSMILHGLKFGFRMSKKRIEAGDSSVVIEMIKSAFPGKKSVLIATEEKLVKAGLETLTDEELKAIACERIPGQDECFIAPVDNEVDKFVTKLMNDALKEAA